MKTLFIVLGLLLTMTLAVLAFVPGIGVSPPFRPTDVQIDVLEVAPPPSTAHKDDIRHVHFTIRNHSRLPIRLIGVAGLCGLNACLDFQLVGYIEIAPGDRYDLSAELAICAGATSFKATAPLYIQAANHLYEYELVARNIAFAEELLPEVP